LYEIPTAHFEKISDTKTPQGILLTVRQKFFSVEEVFSQKLIVALDAVHDAGNLGTILRTAEAFSCGVVILEDSADVFNSKVVRSSMGAIFFLPTIKMTRAEFLAAVKKFDVEILATALDSTAEIYYKHDFTKKSAIVFGSEAAGVSTEILNAAKKIYIPMTGRAESLNVATAAAIVIAEAVK
jgi:TrmH family RNA methyltransferase